MSLLLTPTRLYPNSAIVYPRSQNFTACLAEMLFRAWSKFPMFKTWSCKSEVNKTRLPFRYHCFASTTVCSLSCSLYSILKAEDCLANKGFEYIWFTWTRYSSALLQGQSACGKRGAGHVHELTASADAMY